MPLKDVSNLYETPFLPTQICEVFGAHIADQRAIDAFLGMMEGEPALLLDALRLLVAVVVAAPKRRAAEVLESMPLNFANRLRDVAAAPERDADPKPISISVGGAATWVCSGGMRPMLPMARLSSFRHTAYVSSAEKTSRMISRLFSMLV